MNKQLKTGAGISKSANQEQQSQDLDLRLQRQIQITSKCQQQFDQCRSLLQYCSQFLKILKQQHQSMKKHYLLAKSNPFGGWDTKIKQLTVQAISNKIGQNRSNKEKQKMKQTKEVACSQKKHLQEILDKNKIKNQEEEIQKLQEKLNSLHSKIQTMVMEEYMNEKILNKIRKQSKRSSKIKTVTLLQKQISKYNNWVQQNNLKISNKMIAKQVEEKIMFNLQMMKLLMNKKIINNDYIYQQFVEKQLENSKTLQKIDLLSQQIHQKYSCSILSIKQQSINQQQDEISFTKDGKIGKSLNPQIVIDYFAEIETTIQKIQDYTFEQEIQNKCAIMNSKLDELLCPSKK